jgi:hypothetical protein
MYSVEAGKELFRLQQYTHVMRLHILNSCFLTFMAVLCN